MPHGPQSTEPAIGFLTVLHQPQVGYLGGYLVLNSRARPLEFHCTAPVQPTRTHEILYGTALRPYLYGEQISGALLSRSKERPEILVTDQPEIVVARPHNLPTILISSSLGDQATMPQSTLSQQAEALSVTMESAPHPHAGSPNWVAWSVAQHVVRIAPQHIKDQEVMNRFWDQYGDGIDLREPFDRIREAIAEAHRLTNAA